MKRFAFLISIMAMFAAMFIFNSCEKNKLPEGTGSFAVQIHEGVETTLYFSGK